MRSVEQNPQVFDAVFRRRLEHPEVFAYDVDPGFTASTTSVLTDDDVRRHLAVLMVSVRLGTLLDLGCGISTYGRFLAQEIELDYIGVDFSPVAVAEAKARCGRSRPRELLRCASFEDTKLEAESATCAISFDALYLAAQPVPALQEIRRVLEPHSPVIMSTFYSAPGCISAIAGPEHNWAAAAAEVGMIVADRIDLTKSWRAAMSAKHRARLHEADALRLRYGQWIEPELQVSRSLLGDAQRSGLLLQTCREELHFVT